MEVLTMTSGDVFLPRKAGCHNCRERRIQCDGMKPSCKKCAKKNISCRGYGKKFRWVDQTYVHAQPQQLDQIQDPATRITKRQKVRRWVQPLQTSLSPEEEAPTFIRKRQRSNSTGGSSPTTEGSSESSKKKELEKEKPSSNAMSLMRYQDPSIKVPTYLDLKGFSDLIYVSFTVSKIFADAPGSRSTMPWLASVACLRDPPPMVRLAISSLCTAFFGRINGLKEVVHEGLLLYGYALDDLKSTLLDQSKAFEIYPIITTTALGIYELIVHTTTMAWSHHVAGTARLIEMRGAKQCRSGLEHSLFVTNRTPIALYAIITRKRTFLEKEEWKTIPFEDIIGGKSQHDILMDMLCDLGGILQDYDEAMQLKQTSALAIRSRADMLVTMKRMIESLVDWRLGFEVECPHSCYEIDPSRGMADTINGGTFCVDDEGPVFDTILYYNSLHEATDIMIYNALLMCALQIYQCISKKDYVFSQPGPANRTNCLLLPGDITSVQDIAMEVCRSIEYLLLPSHYGAGTGYVMLPGRVSGMVLDKESRVCKWINAVIARVATIRPEL